MSGSRLRPYLGPVIALLVVLALGAGTVYAAIPNGNGTYYACRVSNTGAVRLINYPKVNSCPAGEKLIKWSATGPAGPVGPVGPVGPAGPADWNAIPNKPASFADGVDNEGVTSVRLLTLTSPTPETIVPTDHSLDSVDCPAGLLAVGGGYIASSATMNVYESKVFDANTWSVWAYNPGLSNATLTAQVTCMRAEPAGLVTAAKNSKFGPKKAHVRNYDK
jgi:hypothetical protein